MSLIDETRTLERCAFFASERLLDVDLNDVEAFHREMRWLHNRSLHQTGVGNGYRVAGLKGDRSVTIGPGYAIDSLGREIVLNRQATQPIPPVAGDSNGTLPSRFYLAVSYPDDSQLDEAEVRVGSCGSRGAVRLSERPLICWVPLTVDTSAGAGVLAPVDPDLRAAVNTGALIVLALIEVFQCRLNRDIDERSFLPRRSARPPKLPYTASAIEPNPVWTVAPITPPLPVPSAAVAQFPATFRLTATVKTTGATFGAIPRYLVRVSDSADFPFVFGPDLQPATVKPPTTGLFYIEPRVDVLLDDRLTDHTKFTASVSLLVYGPTTGGTGLGSSLTQAIDGKDQQFLDTLADVFISRWSIVWVGIEG